MTEIADRLTRNPGLNPARWDIPRPKYTCWELEIFGKARTDAASGVLARKLDRIASEVSDKLTALRDKHIAIRSARGIAGR